MKLIFAIILTATFTACNNNGSTNSDMPPLPVSDNQNTTLTNPTTDTNQKPAATTNPTLPTVSNTNNPTTATVGLNPQHGQPGHRCDIPVGSPLNSSPAPTNNITTTSPVISTQQPVTTQQTAPTPVAPGMNPQHGQPGHRCDIAVGAPLNSKPATTQNVPTIPTYNPVKSDSTKS